MSIIFVGIDLAKNVFAVHGVNEAGKPALVKPSVASGKLVELVATLHDWPRGLFRRPSLGATVHDPRPHRAAYGSQVRRALSPVR